jgi:hypothetical protein
MDTKNTGTKASEKEFTTTKVEFGRPIKFKTSPGESLNAKGERKNQMGGDAMVSQFINVKKNYHDRLKEIAASDRHARRYFCMDDCAFIFDYKVMKALVEVIEKKFEEKKIPLNKRNGGIFLFQGLKKGRRKQQSAQNNEPPAFGRPTLIAAPYYKADAKNYQHIPFQANILRKWFPQEYNDKFVDDQYDGFQHPGNGNSGAGDPPPLEATERTLTDRPVVVEAGDENDDTDYVIKPIITVDDLKTWTKER